MLPYDEALYEKNVNTMLTVFYKIILAYITQGTPVVGGMFSWFKKFPIKNTQRMEKVFVNQSISTCWVYT